MCVIEEVNCVLYYVIITIEIEYNELLFVTKFKGLVLDLVLLLHEIINTCLLSETIILTLNKFLHNLLYYALASQVLLKDTFI